MPRMTVVIAVYGRQRELRRALASMRAQTFADFECIVVDDCSPISVEPIVEELADARFRYLRNPANGGPYNARTLGYRHMQGEYLLQLDSDWEAYPWALSQAVRYLDEYREVDAVAGMHLRQHDATLLAQVTGGKKIVRPADYLKSTLAPDCVGAVRRCVVEGWLRKRRDYFAMEFHQWFTFGLNHGQLYVDEPWTRYHVDGGDRVSVGSHRRRLDDYMKFIEEHASIIETVDTAFLSEVLFNMWFDLLRAGRSAERKQVERYLKLKRMPFVRKFATKVLKRLLAGAGMGSRREAAVFRI